MLQLHIPNQFLNIWIPTNCILSDTWQRFKKCTLNKWIDLQISPFIRLTSLYRIDRGWWRQITGSHYMTALLLTLVTWYLSSQFSWSVCAFLSNSYDGNCSHHLTLLLKALHSLLKYLWISIFFILTFKDFYDLWPVNPTAHRSLSHNFILLLLWCSWLTHPLSFNNHYSLSIPRMT